MFFWNSSGLRRPPFWNSSGLRRPPPVFNVVKAQPRDGHLYSSYGGDSSSTSRDSYSAYGGRSRPTRYELPMTGNSAAHVLRQPRHYPLQSTAEGARVCLE
jgi:hypothetical protein